MLRAGCLLVCLAAAAATATAADTVKGNVSITQLVVPRSAELGSTATLECHYDGVASYVKWWWTSLDGVQRKQIYQRISGSDAEPLLKNVEVKKNDTIILKDLKANNSATYECEVFGLTEERKNMQMIVFSNGTDFTLNATTVEDGPDDDSDPDVELQCAVLDAMPEPELIISVDGGEPLNQTVVELDEEGGLYNVTVQATVSASAVAGREVRCELLYKNENVTHPPYIISMTYASEARDDPSTTEVPEDTTESQVASELQGPNGVCNRGSSLALLVAAIFQLYFSNQSYFM